MLTNGNYNIDTYKWSKVLSVANLHDEVNMRPYNYESVSWCAPDFDGRKVMLCKRLSRLQRRTCEVGFVQKHQDPKQIPTNCRAYLLINHLDYFLVCRCLQFVSAAFRHQDDDVAEVPLPSETVLVPGSPTGEVFVVDRAGARFKPRRLEGHPSIPKYFW